MTNNTAQTPATGTRKIGWWTKGTLKPETGIASIKAAVQRISEPINLIDVDGRPAIGRGGLVTIGRTPTSGHAGDPDQRPLLAYVPPLHPQHLGDSHFRQTYNLRYPYVVGAMANGITSVDMVEAAGRAGMIGFFGAAGLSPDRIEQAVLALQGRLGRLPFGFNLIHSPNEPDLESATVNLYLKRGIRLVSASAYLDLTWPLIYYRIKGIYRNDQGKVVCPNRVIAKISRIEVARKFLSPPPHKLLRHLVESRMITESEADLAASVPVADTMTAEADSGGHTDNQSAITLLPTILALKHQMTQRFNYENPLCVGLGGGIATPDSAAAAFALGAGYILTGSVNQACVEAGTSPVVRRMLTQAGQADVTMAPAADMFEMGVKVQVLKRGTMFPQRASKLYDLYCRHDSFEEIAGTERAVIEKDFLKKRFEDEWEETKAYFARRDPQQIARAEKDPKHKMALVFRSYLGQSSNWANSGDPSRQIDYQIWCGPAMGAFNEWVKGTFLETAEQRDTVTVAMNLLAGASVATRFNWLRNQVAGLPAEIGAFRPLPLADIQQLLDRSEGINS